MTEAPETPAFLETSDGRRLAYVRRLAAPEQAGRPGLVFLGGFQSDMTGSKALALDAWARRRGRAFLRLDYTGHGASSGRFEDGCIGDWARDARDVIEALTQGPQILVGSSMGGWIGLLLARTLPAGRVAGFLGVAAAPDFTEDLVAREMTEAQRAELQTRGRVEIPNPYGPAPTVFTRRLIEDGRENMVLRAPLKIDGPVRLLQGDADPEVPVSTALALLSHLRTPDGRLILVKGAGHRFSEPQELALLEATLEELDARV